LNLKSKLEKTFAAWMKNLKIAFLYEPVKIPYTLRKNYTPDWVISKKGKRKVDEVLTVADLSDKIIIETKGVLDAGQREKFKAIKEQHPDLDIRFVCSRDNYITKKKNKKREGGMRYSDWCEKYGFGYHIGAEPPRKWFN